MKTFLLPALFLVLTLASVNAQTPSPTPDLGGKVALWICTTPGGTYEVALRSIVSVSTCEYVVDNIARVTEVNIDTAGNMAVRFYYIEPNTPNTPTGVGLSTINKVQEIATNVADRTGQDAWKKVVKNYPTTTHAHTIEYRVENKDDLTTIFTSAEKAFRTATASTVSVGAATNTTPSLP